MSTLGFVFVFVLLLLNKDHSINKIYHFFETTQIQTQSKEVKISIQQARMLILALAECMDKLNQNHEMLLNELKRSFDTDVINVSMDGGGFGDQK